MIRKDKITIMFSRLFPTTHSRRGEPTRFIEKVMLGEKIHQIRRNYDKWKILADKTNEKRYSISLCQCAVQNMLKSACWNLASVFSES